MRPMERTPLPDYEKQVYAAVLGKTIGVYMGRPFEGWWKRSIEPKWGSIDRYVNEDVGKPLVVADDDISGTFTFVKALSDWAGDPRAVDPAFFGETWRNYLIEGRTILWWGGVSLSTEHTAWTRLKRGVPSPESGSMKRNGKIVAELIGAQIFIDAFGMVAPGDPDLAERFADGAARVSHDGEAVLAAKVVARMVAAAFVEKDMEKVLDIGAATLPPDSLVARVHRDVRAWAREDGDWRRTYDRIFAKYGYDKYGGNCHVIPNHAVMVMAWSYAGSDFFEAQRIVNTAGWDTDCNAANVGTVSALVVGLDHLCDRYDFRTPFADRLIIPTADGTDSVTDCLRVARRIAALGRRVMGWPAAHSPSDLTSEDAPATLTPEREREIVAAIANGSLPHPRFKPEEAKASDGPEHQGLWHLVLLLESAKLDSGEGEGVECGEQLDAQRNGAAERILARVGSRIGWDPRARHSLGDYLDRGKESLVYRVGNGKVRKVRKLSPYSCDAVLDDLARIVYHNYLFPADAYAVAGVLVYERSGRDEYWLDLVQPLVVPLTDGNGGIAEASESQILAALRKCPVAFNAIGSLEERGPDESPSSSSDSVDAAKFQAYNGDFIVTDFRPGRNTFIDAGSGEVRFIDADILVNDPSEPFAASRFGTRRIESTRFDPRSLSAHDAATTLPLHDFSQPGSLQGWMVERPKAVLFDLDGTLLDTLPGLAASVNAVLRAHGEPERSLEEVRAFVGNGVRKLVARAAKGGEDRPDYTELLAEYRAHYLAHASEGSAPYPGIPELLAALRARGVKLGVVTNKDEDAARALMERFFPGAFDVVLGGNAGRAPKPDPATPRAALEALGVSPAEALYVGDTDVDAATARGAGMDLRLCSWGFRARGDLEKLGATIVDTPDQILGAFESHAENAEFDSHAENAEPNGGASSPSEPSLVTRHSSLVTAKRVLRVRFAGPCRLSTPVSVPAGQSGSYSTPNAPWLYRGMTATVRGRAGEVPAGAALRAFVRHAGGAVSRGEPLALHSGAPFELRWTLDDPAIPSTAILDFGLELACEAGSAGTIFVESISYDGSVALDYGDEWNPARWSARIDGWIDGMDRQLGSFSDDPEPQRRFGSDGDPCVYVTGNRSWGDQTLRCRFNIHAADRAGVVLRWQGMRRHYAFIFEKERALLVRQDYGETVLAERPFVLTENEMVDLEARAEGARLSLRVNGAILLEAEDPTFATGGAGFYAQQGILGVAKPSIRAVAG